MRLHRPVLVALALGAVLPMSAASAAAGVTAAGSAVSSATLATLSVGDLTVASTTLQGHDVAVATLSAIAQTLSSDAPAVSFVPVTLDGVKTGEVTVTPANSPQTVGAVTTGALPLNVLSASSPSATLTAAKPASGPVSALEASLGSLTVLGMPVSLDGGVKVGSATDAAKAQAGKMLTISNVSLPNLSDLLAALGIDITKLPVDTLNGLVDSLPVAVSAAAESALAAANDAIDAADGAYQAALADVSAKVADLAAAAADLDAALAAATIPATEAELTALGIDAPIDHSEWDTLSGTVAGQALQAAILAVTPANDALDAPLAAYVAAKAALATAQAALATATAAIQPLIDDLAGIVDGVLAGAPLVEIGAAEIGTNALASTTKSATVTGSISGVKVLGEDVLAAVTGDTEVDVAALANTVATQVNSAIATVTGALSTVLSSATGALNLVVPAPSIKLLTKQTSTGVDGAFNTANVLVTALQVDLGSVTVPDVYALVGADTLPGVLPTATGFKTAPLSVKVGVLAEAARFSPTSGANPGSHPATGAPFGLAMIATIGTALAFGARRVARSE